MQVAHLCVEASLLHACAQVEDDDGTRFLPGGIWQGGVAHHVPEQRSTLRALNVDNIYQYKSLMAEKY